MFICSKYIYVTKSKCRSPTSVESSTANSVSKFNNRHFHDRHFPSSFSRHIIMRRLHFLIFCYLKFPSDKWGLLPSNSLSRFDPLQRDSGDPTSKQGGNDDKLYRVMSWKSFLNAYTTFAQGHRFSYFLRFVFSTF